MIITHFSTHNHGETCLSLQKLIKTSNVALRTNFGCKILIERFSKIMAQLGKENNGNENT